MNHKFNIVFFGNFAWLFYENCLENIVKTQKYNNYWIEIYYFLLTELGKSEMSIRKCCYKNEYRKKNIKEKIDFWF